MIKRGPFTVVVITRSRLIRADFAGGRTPALKERFSCQRPDVDDLATLVDTTLRLGSPRVKAVFVLCGDLWTSVLSIESEVIRRVSDQDLNEMLAFEAEPFSGITAFEASVGFQELAPNATDRRFWATVSQSVDREYVAAVVDQFGGTFCGFAHPGGVSRPLAFAESDGWERVEYWDDAVICVRPSPSTGGTPDVQIINGSPSSGAYHELLEKWHENTSHTNREVLVGHEDLAVDEPEAQITNLSDDRQLDRWLVEWGAALRTTADSVPAVLPVKQPMSPQMRLIISMAAAACVAVLCSVFYQSNAMRLADLAHELEHLAEPARELSDLRAKAQKLDRQLAKDRQRTTLLKAEVNSGEQVLRAYRDRIPFLLSSLADAAGDNVLIEEISATSNTTVISGSALDAVSMHHLAEAISKPAAPVGWEVLPPEKAVAAAPNGQPIWTFSMTLRDRHPPSPPSRKSAIAVEK